MGGGIYWNCAKCGHQEMVVYGPTMLTVSHPHKTNMRCLTCKSIRQICDDKCNPSWANQPIEHRCCCRARGHQFRKWNGECPLCDAPMTEDKDKHIMVD